MTHRVTLRQCRCCIKKWSGSSSIRYGSSHYKVPVSGCLDDVPTLLSQFAGSFQEQLRMFFHENWAHHDDVLILKVRDFPAKVRNRNSTKSHKSEKLGMPKSSEEHHFHRCQGAEVVHIDPSNTQPRLTDGALVTALGSVWLIVRLKHFGFLIRHIRAGRLRTG